MYTTLGAPSGARGGSNGDQSGSASRISTAIRPANGLVIDTSSGWDRGAASPAQDESMAQSHRGGSLRELAACGALTHPGGCDVTTARECFVHDRERADELA